MKAWEKIKAKIYMERGEAALTAVVTLMLEDMYRARGELLMFKKKSYYSYQLWSFFSVGWTFLTPIKENYAYNSWHVKKVIVNLTEM